MTQKSHSWDYTPRKPELKETHVLRKKRKKERDTCIPMLIAALFIIARTWKQPRCPSEDKWIQSCGTYTQWNITWPLKRIRLNQF